MNLVDAWQGRAAELGMKGRIGISIDSSARIDKRQSLFVGTRAALGIPRSCCGVRAVAGLKDEDCRYYSSHTLREDPVKIEHASQNDGGPIGVTAGAQTRSCRHSGGSTPPVQ
jgi:hypothetical protein